MIKFKVGDKVLYKTINLRGIITEKSSENLWAVAFQDKSSRYCFDSELELVETRCPYCKCGEPLNDASNSDFTLTISHDENNYHMYVEFSDEVWWGDDYATINYCPMCGRKLEVAE